MSAIIQAGAVPRWRPSPLILASMGLHVAAGVVAAVEPHAWPWCLAAIAANHAALTVLGLWPRSRLLGPNFTRLPATAIARGEVALTFDDGPHPSWTPRVLDVLARNPAKATFFMVGQEADQYPELVRQVVQAGHYVADHTWDHESLEGVSQDEFVVEVSEAAALHEHVRYTAQGLIGFFGSSLFQTALHMTSERPSRDLILFRGTRAS